MTIQLNRRDFLKMTGMSFSGLILASSPISALAAKDKDLAALKPDGFLLIDENNQVTFWAPRPELGQGTKTGLALVAAEELDYPYESLKLEHANTNAEFGYIGVGGSFGLQGSYKRVRETAARARLMLLQAAAAKWQVDVEQLSTKSGYIVHQASNKQAPYGEFVAAASNLTLPEKVQLKDVEQFSQIGTNAKRYDNQDIVKGKTQFGLDKKLPGMLYASIERSPTPNGRVETFNQQQLMAIPGVVQVMKLEGTGFPHANHVREGVAVLAESHWQALKARQSMNVSWKTGQDKINSQQLSERMQSAVATKGNEVLRKGDDVFGVSDDLMEATYELPFLAHSPMETPNATAVVTGDRCEIWCGIQSGTRLQERLVEVLGLAKEQITVYPMLCGGSFGRRLEVEYAIEAAMLAQKSARPVQLLWSREDDMRLSQYRTASMHRMKAAFNRGELAGVGESSAILSIAGQQGMTNAFKNGVDTYYEDASFFLYGIDNLDFQQHIVEADMPVGWWRGVSATNYSVSYECWVDEIAHRLNQDPLEYRLTLLSRAKQQNAADERRLGLIERTIQVLEKVAEKTNWRKRQGEGLGIACFSFGGRSPVATVVESKKVNNQIKIVKVTSAVECGVAVNPDIINAQFEGGTIFGLSSLFHQQITLDQGAVVQSNFHDFASCRMPETPEIETHILPSSRDPEGVGEPSLMTIAPAVLNSIYASTGKRFRSIPISYQI